ncbi:MAG: hypothetical protein UX02_C0001G0195 [Candidatus Moranbacteria bacterium GW2011_GWC1_45_18]|nr:MAG: hypothetical protein UT79_C0002G0202 [Candidatus Moranbacteria bacterium GW2011_GWC2_40_12]KKT32618.1 MAG: hypothetical protein UW19_C0018G0040 [Candidatus Moranbacteria bacterium GW2011_GWF2_44_10]KKU00747.1 MAG: hypothetical protein UX02_C0001G0195 [Candidatus Moranbacteria bacterium GW2011_GWC1_45_18]OGI35200.1 MAG: hypothetical protein A2407_03690 [Candidatus Moranbacteria bacterium RIFOXYC1_FULL_44_8]OGI39938.1 MAG: hypothetical protein A2374_02610 [Candidatus Moranbacteria bacteri
MKITKIAFWISWGILLVGVISTLGAWIYATLLATAGNTNQYLFWKNISDKSLASLPLGSILLLIFSAVHVVKLNEINRRGKNEKE